MNRYIASLTSLGRRPSRGTQIHHCFRKSARPGLLSLQRRGEGLKFEKDRAHTRLRRPNEGRFWLCSDMHCSTSVSSEPVSEEGRLVEAGTSGQETVSRCGAIVTSRRRDAKKGRKGKRKRRRPLRCHKGEGRGAGLSEREWGVMTKRTIVFHSMMFSRLAPLRASTWGTGHYCCSELYSPICSTTYQCMRSGCARHQVHSTYGCCSTCTWYRAYPPDQLYGEVNW